MSLLLKTIRRMLNTVSKASNSDRKNMELKIYNCMINHSLNWVNDTQSFLDTLELDESLAAKIYSNDWYDYTLQFGGAKILPYREYLDILYNMVKLKREILRAKLSEFKATSN